MPKRTRAIKKTDVKSKKPWIKKVGINEYDAIKKQNKAFLIVCEGYTEKHYFQSFPVVSAEVKAIPLPSSCVQIVECAIEMAKEDIYDEIWCIYDMDTKPDQQHQKENFNKAFELAKNNHIHVAYSNDAFELWFVLHYEFSDQKQHRKYYFDKLSSFFDMNYKRDGKKQVFSKTIYGLLEEDEKADQKNAIDRAEKLHQLHKELKPHEQNPVSLVYLLVNELNQYLRQ